MATIQIQRPKEQNKPTKVIAPPAEKKLQVGQNLSATKDSIQNSQYQSRINGEISKDRLRQPNHEKRKNQTIKWIDEFTRQFIIKDGTVQVHEEIPFLNSSVKGKLVKNYEDKEFLDKHFKRFTISATLKESELIKQFDYFTQSPIQGISLKEDNSKFNFDFSMGDFETFDTFQVKTYLFDRNLTQKITN